MFPQLLKSCLVLAAIICSGMTESGLGVALPELAIRSNSTTDQIATIFMWRGVAAIAGALVIGTAIDKFDELLVVGLCLLAQALATLATALPHQLWLMSLFSSISSFMLSGLDTASFVVVTNSLKSDSRFHRIFIQGQGLSFIIGSTLAPLMMAPILAKDTFPVNSTKLEHNHTIGYDKVVFSFVAIATPGFITSFCILITAMSFGNKFKKTTTNCSVEESTLRHELPLFGQNRNIILPVALYLCFFLIFGGIDMTLVGLLVTYIQNYLGWDVSVSALSSSLFSGIRLSGSILTLLIINFIDPINLIVVDSLILLMGFSLWVGLFKYEAVITWFGIIVGAIGTSNIFCTSFDVANKLLPLSGTLAAAFNIAYLIGSLSIPALTGLLLNKYHAKAFPWTLSVCSVCCLILIVLTKVSIIFKVPTRQKRTTEETSLLIES